MENKNNQSFEEMIAETMKNRDADKADSQIDTQKASTKSNADDFKFKYYDEDSHKHKHEHSSDQHHQSKSSEKDEKKKNKAVIIACVVLGIILVFFIAVGIVFYHYVSMLDIKDEPAEVFDSINIEYENDSNSPDGDINKLKRQMKDNYDKTGLMQSDDVMNILLLGTDERENNERGRSDSMMILSLNKATKEIIMTSFLRDMYVTIPGKGDSKLNHSYAYGGADLTIETIEKNFKIKIDNYIQVNFSEFVAVVDAVGGVDIDLTDEEVNYVNAYVRDRDQQSQVTGSGKQHLNGEQALAYSRIRYIGTDFGRTERQRTVLTDVINKASKLSLSELNDFVEVLFPQVTTNLSKTEIASLVLKATTYFKYDVNQYRIPIDDTWQNMTIDHMAVLGVDFKANVNYLAKNIYHYEEDLID